MGRCGVVVFIFMASFLMFATLTSFSYLIFSVLVFFVAWPFVLQSFFLSSHLKKE